MDTDAATDTDRIYGQPGYGQQPTVKHGHTARSRRLAPCKMLAYRNNL